MKKYFFFQFFIKKTSNIISELNDDFSEDFFEVLHISVGQTIKILETRPDFLKFSAKTHNHF
jgi:hypothetical protein